MGEGGRWREKGSDQKEGEIYLLCIMSLLTPLPPLSPSSPSSLFDPLIHRERGCSTIHIGERVRLSEVLCSGHSQPQAIPTPTRVPSRLYIKVQLLVHPSKFPVDYSNCSVYYRHMYKGGHISVYLTCTPQVYRIMSTYIN